MNWKNELKSKWNSKEKLEKIKDIIKEFDEDENMETYQALDKIRELV